MQIQINMLYYIKIYRYKNNSYHPKCYIDLLQYQKNRLIFTLFNSGRVGFKQVPKFQFSNVLNLLNRTGKAYTHKDGYPEFLNGLKYPAVQSKFILKDFFLRKTSTKSMYIILIA